MPLRRPSIRQLLTTAGDMVYLDATGNLARLPIGAEAATLKITSSVPTWSAAGGGGGGGSSIPATAILDHFDRADGALGANWSQAIASYSMPTIVGNQVALTQFPSAAWTFASFGANQEAYAAISQTSGTSTPISLLLRFNNLNQAGVTSGYRVVFYLNSGGASSVEAFIVQSGTNTSLGLQNAAIPAGQTNYLARAIGSTLSIYYSSGTTYTLAKQWTDSTITSGGYIGFYSSNNSGTGVVLDNFGGGTVV